MDLTLKEQKILAELDKDSRQSNAEIAKTIKLSKSTTNYIITNLEQRGIIKQYNTVVDTGKLGLIGFRVYLKIQGTTPDKEKEIIAYLKNHPAVTWLTSIEGDYTLGIFIPVKNIREMNQIWREIHTRYGTYIEDHLIVVMNKIVYLSRAYLTNTHHKTITTFVTPPQQENLTGKDKELLKLLAPNARISILDLAKKLKTTPKTIMAHIKQLEKKEIIIGYKTVFNISQLGYHHYKYLINLQNATTQKQNEIRTYLRQHKNVIYEDEAIGGYDIEIELEVLNTETLRTFIDELKQQYGVYIKNYKTLYFYKEHKYVYLPESY